MTFQLRSHHLILYFLLTGAMAFNLMPRHGDTQGTGHGHSMSHGGFNFTASGIAWPTCPRQCCNAFFDYFPEPVNHPLCVSPAFYANVTECVAKNCTEYEQGAFAVVAEIECPEDPDYAAEDVRQALKDVGGDPQVCMGVNNQTISCQNGTAGVTSLATGLRLPGFGIDWMGTALLIGGLLMLVVV
ncbi:hypothetical protein TWF481_006096 [Arthrobotrys musiformis]|uniref:Extracellular membrane protein CFEM domain-containing protein n=1 Tax=Arthrobotrys musiformis TaxID=47236 RepID=A0AAV9WLF4_9PEZI